VGGGQSLKLQLCQRCYLPPPPPRLKTHCARIGLKVLIQDQRRSSGCQGLGDLEIFISIPSFHQMFIFIKKCILINLLGISNIPMSLPEEQHSSVTARRLCVINAKFYKLSFKVMQQALRLQHLLDLQKQ
jgi:hypothetical protein